MDSNSEPMYRPAAPVISLEERLRRFAAQQQVRRLGPQAVIKPKMRSNTPIRHGKTASGGSEGEGADVTVVTQKRH